MSLIFFAVILATACSIRLAFSSVRKSFLTTSLEELLGSSLEELLLLLVSLYLANIFFLRSFLILTSSLLVLERI
jgi:hypothetical protein